MNFSTKKLLLSIVTLFFFLQITFATVTNLTGFYRSGQVFLTWTNISNSAAFYKVYRSTSVITDSSQLAGCEYLGMTYAKSALDNNLSKHDSVDRYVHIDSGAAPLTEGTGLFVLTTLVDGSYYYAVTTLVDNVEDVTITPGLNSLSAFIPETVATPQPVFQETRLITNQPVKIYSVFVSSKYAADQPPMIKAGFLPYDFALYLNNATGNNPLKIFLHGGGTDFLQGITTVNNNEVNLSPEDYYPDANIDISWWGSNANFDVFNNANNSSPPTSGTDFNYTQLRLTAIINWAIKNLPIDSNRIYLKSVSQGSPGAYFYSIIYPDKIAAAEIHDGVFSYACDSDWQSLCLLNAGAKNRKKSDNRIGTIATDLPCNLGIGTYQALNGGWVVHQYPERDLPVIYSINGKNDVLMGWTEKTIYYDSVNNNHTGGYYFWDDRDHGANFGQTWGADNWDLFRYRRNSSYPAFAHCSLNEDFGNGNGNSGALYGTINGALDWNDTITDEVSQWQIQVCVRNLIDYHGNTITYPDSATADITPRRLQQFHPSPGNTITWNVMHHQEVIQSGSLTYNGGIITIPAVKIFKDTSVLQLTVQPLFTFYEDADSDGFGNADSFIQVATQPDGYVTDSTDCNDADAYVHPGATEVCNSIDDNCNGSIDDGLAFTTYYADADGDTYGDANNSVSSCAEVLGYVIDNTDCNDNNAAVNPAATEVCNNIDDNCNGSIDEGLVFTTYYADNDGDNYGDANNSVSDCAPVSGYVTDSTDCDDTNPNVNPGAQEIPNNGIDDNCNGEIDEFGVGISPINSEAWSLSIYPNPTDGAFVVDLKLSDEESAEAKIEVLNLLGQIIISENTTLEKGKLQKEIQLNDAATEGMYLVKVIVGDRAYITPINYFSK